MSRPSGISYDGTNAGVPVAQYRSNSRTITYGVDAKSLTVHNSSDSTTTSAAFCATRPLGDLVGNNWGSRCFREMDRGPQAGPQLDNNCFTDHQECQYVASATMICGGITNLPQSAWGGGAP